VQGLDGTGRVAAGTGAFGPNAWLVEDMYAQYLADPASVSASWQEFFADYRPAGSQAQAAPPAPAPAVEAASGPAPAVARSPSAAPAPAGAGPGGVAGATPLRGAAARIVANMEASLGVPTATSVRVVPAKLLEVNRTIVNNQLRRTTGGKVSFTHLIGYAVVKGLGAVPSMNAAFVADADGKGTPGVVRHEHVGLGLAVDVEKSGGRTLLVPCIADADTRDFQGFVAAYEDLVRKIHTNKIAPDDFVGTTVTLTNPGTIGTVQSVPRLMPGQGLIVGVGALGVPAGFEAADPRKLAELGVGKTVTITSTYDHRIIQGAESGLFLAHVSECLMGGHGFYDEVFASLEIPYEAVTWQRDDNSSVEDADGGHERLIKQNHVQTLVNMYRVRGHLIAHLDPLDAEEVDLHPELDPLHYGLTIWDLPRHFVADGLAGKELATLDEILSVLRDAYCRTLGVEYMHIQDPEQKRWIQQHVEGVSAATSPDDQRHILDRLNAAEVFERFLHTRYVGQKRFGLEGAESAIVILDALLDEAAREGLHESVMGMSHRGRLNVLANIVGKSYGEIFEEFEGNLDPESVQGSGDVKYHKGAKGIFVARNGATIPLTMASNPSHLEAVDPVVVGMARARQDALGGERGSGPRLVDGTGDPFPILPILLHGDAAFAGQGVVAETLNLSGLAGYRTGGTVHVVINNQLGFTTAPEAARSTVYPTDVAKMVQAPIFHVNGDDPEACARAARLAFGFRQAFHKDVVIDMVCYRRHGHNEGDDPSYTQPLMYALIDVKRSVRKLYTEALVRRGDISLEEAEQALDDFGARLQAALDETRAEAEGAPPPPLSLPEYVQPDLYIPRIDSGIDPETVTRLATIVRSVPDGFVMHPKLARQFEQRDKVVADGEIDWALGEALAFGSLLIEGTNVRVTGQDTRRGTFSHRHAVLVDHQTGAEHVPLEGLGEGGRFTIRDSLLSEYACVGFEYGYSVEAPNDLVAWEAQFGDFWNGAEIIVDNFLVAAEDKWGQKSGLVLLLPHGYEGQGPEHSSARIERFLTLCARGNLRVTQPTTSSQYFHLLRAQVRVPDRKPLIVFTPKSLLRARQARSPVAAFTTGSFDEVLDDPAASESLERAAVSRIVLCSGKVAFDALGRRDELGAAGAHVAVVRMEQLYPWPKDGLADVLARYPGAEEVVWLQEEPENMGAWNFVHSRLHRLLRSSHTLRHVSRAESASPASGSAALHRLELEDLLVRAVG